jgi:hypothetical protein
VFWPEIELHHARKLPLEFLQRDLQPRESLKSRDFFLGQGTAIRTCAHTSRLLLQHRKHIFQQKLFYRQDQSLSRLITADSSRTLGDNFNRAIGELLERGRRVVSSPVDGTLRGSSLRRTYSAFLDCFANSGLRALDQDLAGSSTCTRGYPGGCTSGGFLPGVACASAQQASDSPSDGTDDSPYESRDHIVVGETRFELLRRPTPLLMAKPM